MHPFSKVSPLLILKNFKSQREAILQQSIASKRDVEEPKLKTKVLDRLKSVTGELQLVKERFVEASENQADKSSSKILAESLSKTLAD